MKGKTGAVLSSISGLELGCSVSFFKGFYAYIGTFDIYLYVVSHKGGVESSARITPMDLWQNPGKGSSLG